MNDVVETSQQFLVDIQDETEVLFTSQTNWILIVEDNGRLRSLLARYLMLNCTSLKRSCAIYHLSLNGQARLTYGQGTIEAAAPTPHSDPIELDFAIFEAESVQRALNWLKQTRPAKVTLVSDVLLPDSGEAGLPALLATLASLKILVNLLFVSSEAQSRAIVAELMDYQPVYFLVKGSAAWRKLPTALIQHARHFEYRLLPLPGQALSLSPQPALTGSPVAYQAEATPRPVNPEITQRIAASPKPVLAQQPLRASQPSVPGTVPPVSYSGREVKSTEGLARSAPAQSSSGQPEATGRLKHWWSRLFGWLTLQFRFVVEQK
jgi:hypothetical protein